MNVVSKSIRVKLKGFSLVELMVAMAIGLFGVLIMMQVFSLSEQNKQSTTSGNDAMNEGVVSLYALQRDIRMGGYGIADMKMMGCNVLLRAGVTLVAMAPVTINHAVIPAGDANTDTLLVVYANTNGSPQGDSITALTVADQYPVQTPAAFTANDWVIATPQVQTCATTPLPLTPALTLTRVASVVSPNVTVAVGAGLALAAVPSTTPPTFPTLFNLGQRTPKIVAYAIRNGNLTMCDYTTNDCSVASAANWVAIGNNIVSLRAQYGRDTAAAGAMDGIVDVFNQAAPSTACDWARVSAVRLALVARSTQPASSITNLAPVWEGTLVDNPTGSTAAPINLTGNAAWQNYRYKVFQTVVPLRNISWMGKVTGC
ncbi:MAG: PilW family protein [Rhodoferax sp.]|uniref:PilW family protein n=1 Tax=Rhodoferax sp. TaxID=50421 RepID=UPI00301A9FFC